MTNKSRLKSPTSNTLKEDFHEPFEILVILQNSTILVNRKVMHKIKVNSDRLKPCHDKVNEENIQIYVETQPFFQPPYLKYM